MVLEGLYINASELVLDGELLERASSLITMFKAIGGLIIIYLLFAIYNVIVNRRRARELREMRVLLEKIDKKVNKKRK